MAKDKKLEYSPITEEILKGMKEGDPIARYGFFVNLTFVSSGDDHVTMMDSFGNTKKVYKWLFLKHAFLKD